MFARFTKKRPNVSILGLRGAVNSKLFDQLVKGLESVPTDTKCLAILVNSPGGSPAYSHKIFKRLRLFHDQTGAKVLTFAEDVAASGGYFILSAGDEIFATKGSIVGSVGAIALRTELHKTLANLGVDLTQYDLRKYIRSYLNPLQKLTPEMMALADNYIGVIFREFTNHVEAARGGKFKSSREDREKSIYNSGVYLGEQALSHGLIDGVGYYQEILTERYPDHEFRYVDMTPTYGDKLRKSLGFGNLETFQGSQGLDDVLRGLITK